MDEIKKVADFFKDPRACEIQVWEKKTVDYFKEKENYSIYEDDDGSWWIADESNYWD